MDYLVLEYPDRSVFLPLGTARFTRPQLDLLDIHSTINHENLVN